jgi:hypothetical protein
VKKTIFSILLFSTLLSFAQNNDPIIPTSGNVVKDFVPQGWKKIALANGDLNKDGVDDFILIVENKSTLNLKKNTALGSDTLNLNPRILIILFGELYGGYKTAEVNKNIIPTASSEETPCLADPMDEGNLEVKKDVLLLKLQYWLSCGSWSVTNKTYTFRYQHNQFELIGYDETSFQKSTGETTDKSINFSTKKKCTSIGGNMFSKDLNKPKTTCVPFEVDKLKSLKELTSKTEIEF